MHFGSDNHLVVHPQILDAIVKANSGSTCAYGLDDYTKEAKILFNKTFGECETYFVGNGTAANVLALASIVRSYEAVICTKQAHINTDECGAFEKYIGGKLLTTSKDDYFLFPEEIEYWVNKYKNFCHAVQPKVVSITQTNESGRIYSIEQLKAIAQTAHKNYLYLHMDGARIANAAAYLGCSLKEITKDIGVDILSFGGTKNGLMFGDAIVFLNKNLAENFEYIQKQGMQLFSKMRFISAQFIALLQEDLWFKNAKNANEMAEYLVSQIKIINHVKLARELNGNEVFLELDLNFAKKLQEKYLFYIWETNFKDEKEKAICRFVTSFCTTKEDVDLLINEIKTLPFYAQFL